MLELKIESKLEHSYLGGKQGDGNNNLYTFNFIFVKPKSQKTIWVKVDFYTGVNKFHFGFVNKDDYCYSWNDKNWFKEVPYEGNEDWEDEFGSETITKPLDNEELEILEECKNIVKENRYKFINRFDTM